MRAVDLVLDDPALVTASRHSWALGHFYEFSDVPRGPTASSEKCEDNSGDSTDEYWKAHMHGNQCFELGFIRTREENTEALREGLTSYLMFVECVT